VTKILRPKFFKLILSFEQQNGYETFSKVIVW